MRDMSWGCQKGLKDTATTQRANIGLDSRATLQCAPLHSFCRTTSPRQEAPKFCLLKMLSSSASPQSSI
ncbi:unnamed protein product [Gulo gulo]|uniref:Uncharacterized protein n=1 Tax=Gulo gulo TaxID=48420 RepID=A0A9X9PWL4_GULGU|nr:unnamed protein product [Gulo gulo]